MCGTSLINAAQLEKVKGVVERAVSGGAEVVTGGQINTSMEARYHYEPTVLTNLQQSDEIMQRPVLPVFSP